MSSQTSFNHTKVYLNALLPSSRTANHFGNKRTSTTSSSTDESDSETLPNNDQTLFPGSKSASSLSDDDSLTSSAHDIRIQRIIDLLGSDEVQEEDKPEALKELLESFLGPNSLGVVSLEETPDLDSVVLSLLHRHREDVYPTGQTFTQPTTPTKPTVSRSSSFRRAFSSSLPLTPGRSIGFGDRPHSPSPLRPASPLVTRSESPVIGSPRVLSVTASEFQPRNSPVPAPTPPLPSVWGSGSPLGTPRLTSSTNSSYFPPTVSNANLTVSSSIPRSPWGVHRDSASSLPAISTSASSEGSIEEPSEFDSFPSWPHESLNTNARNDHFDEMLFNDQDWEPFEKDFQNHLPLPNNSTTPNYSPTLAMDHLSGMPNMAREIGLTGTASAYTMTPLDMLSSVFADSNITPEEIEDALAQNAYDIEHTIEFLISQKGVSPPAPLLDELRASAPSPFGRISPSPRGSNHLIPPRSDSPRGSAPPSPRWSSRPLTPTNASGGGANYPASAATNRVCRYYLQGSCLRSDCRYNHDISKAVCRFWLRGHCLKGPDRCDFMHSIPPHLAQDVALLRMRDRNERQQQQRALAAVKDLNHAEEDFPSLSSNLPSRHGPSPSNRYTAALKRTNTNPNVNVTTSRTSPTTTMLRSESFHGRPSIRLTLRPPVLMPTLNTGQAVEDSYVQYRTTFLALGAARTRCLERAAQCYSRGDSAGARTWSREAEEHNKQRLAASRDSSRNIVSQRQQLLKEAYLRFARQGKTDDLDRTVRGRDLGFGIILGITALEALPLEFTKTSPEERCESLIDLHGLYGEEAIEYLSQFLNILKRDHFTGKGLAYAFVGTPSQISSSESAQLSETVLNWLEDNRLAYRPFGSVIAIDPQSF